MVVNIAIFRTMLFDDVTKRWSCSRYF